MNDRKALVLGATGLIGKQVLSQLITNDNYSTVNVLTRRPTGFSSPKVHEFELDSENTLKNETAYKVDHVYCCLGTTIRKAGSQEKFEKIDLQLPLEIAAICKNNGAETFVLVSSIGANKDSKNFYLRTKGRVEADLEKLNFKSLVIMQPSILLGKREEKRLGEKFGKLFMAIFTPLLVGPMKKYRGAKDFNVARTMINSALSDNPGIFKLLGPYAS